MTYKLADRVYETSTTTGTSTLNLGGTKTGFQSFVQGVGDGEKVPYLIDDGTDWEVGLGTVTSGSPDTLSRDTVYQSTNSDAAVNWGAGTRNVRLSLPANLYATKQDITDFISSATDGTITTLDEVIFRDVSDSGNTKKDTIASIIDLVPDASVSNKGVVQKANQTDWNNSQADAYPDIELIRQNMSGGAVLQVKSAYSTTGRSSTVGIPNDDTPPRSTEGSEAITVSFTPSSASSTLYIYYGGAIDLTGSNNGGWVLFKDNGSNCIDASPMYGVAAGYAMPNTKFYKEAASNTSTRTYKLRYGGDGLGVDIGSNTAKWGVNQGYGITIFEVQE
jgi:hypothetical protein